MTLSDGQLMTRGDAAKALGVSNAYVWKLEGQGVLASTRTVGGFALYWTKDVERLARERKKNPPKRRGAGVRAA